MAITGLIGRPGSGKTYDLTRRVILAADRDRLVFTNYPVKHPNVFYFTPDQLLDLPPGLVVIDEAHLWFPSRMSLKLPMSWLAGMSQTRKRGWDMIWSAQHETRVDRAIRDVTDFMWLTRSYLARTSKVNGVPRSHPIWFSSTCWEPETFRAPKKSCGRQISLFNRRVAESYDTHGKIEEAVHTQQKGDVYAKRGGSVLEGVLK